MMIDGSRHLNGCLRSYFPYNLSFEPFLLSQLVKHKGILRAFRTSKALNTVYTSSLKENGTRSEAFSRLTKICFFQRLRLFRLRTICEAVCICHKRTAIHIALTVFSRVRDRSSCEIFACSPLARAFLSCSRSGSVTCPDLVD